MPRRIEDKLRREPNSEQQNTCMALFAVWVGVHHGRGSSSLMKSWHIGVIIAVLIGYALGIIFPSIGQTAKAKLGL